MTTTDKAAPKLKRCPACGRRDSVGPEMGGTWFSVACWRASNGCGASGPAADDYSDAIAAWNALPRRKRVKRAKAERAVEEMLAGQIRVCCAVSALDISRGSTDRDAARARLMAMLTGEDGKTKGAP